MKIKFAKRGNKGNMKSKKDDNLYRKRFQDVVKFLVVKEILKKYESFEQYKKATNSDKAYKLHCAISPQLLKSLGRTTKKYNAEKFIRESEKIFTYHFHCHKKYKSEKKFSRNSWFEINPEIVKSAFENKKDWNIANDKLFSKDAHIWVDKNIYYTADNYYNKSTPEKKEIFNKILHNIKEEIKEEENNMTKLDRIQYQKDYEAGLKAFPLEDVLKAEAKKKRADDKRLKTKIKKMTQQAMVEEELEIQRLKKEIEKLRAENNHLKSLKDLNSDIPEDDIPSSIEYKDLDKYFPDGIDEDDPSQKDLIARISEDCWKKLNEEAEQEKHTFEENDKNFDYEKELANVQNELKNFKEEPIANVAVVKQDKTTIPDDDIPETFDDHREDVAKEIANAIKDGIVGKATGKRYLKIIGCENYRLSKIPEQLANNFCTKKHLAFVEKFIKTIIPFKNEFDPDELKWLTKNYRDLKVSVNIK